jgi:DNA-binding XRE family transcriptional regulator
MPNQPASTSEFNSKILGHNIKEGRKRMNNMPQKELADLAGISRHTLIDIESGKRDTSLRTVAEIAKHLQTTLSQLLASQSEITHEKGNNDEEKSLNTNGYIDERAIVEVHLDHLRGHISTLEKTCADLREDKASMREELNRLRPQLAS